MAKGNKGIRQIVANWLDPSHNNSLSGSIGQDFLRHGGRTMMQNWSQTMMTEPDKYTGYMFGAIHRRSVAVAQLAKYNLMTRANEKTVTAAKKKNEPIVHPYIAVINQPGVELRDDDIAEGWAFWYRLQTYLDLTGVAYILAVRAKANSLTSDVKYFKLLNSYDVMRVRSTVNPSVVEGYTESHDGLYRELDPDQVIEVRCFYPFSRDKSFGMADAAKDSQFTLKQQNEQVRSTLDRNTKYPGVVLVGNADVTLDEEQMRNFKGRMAGRRQDSQGEPIFASGTGAPKWVDMQVDLKKSAPIDVNEMSLNALIAASGVSRTKFGIEQSGVTRDTADVQNDQFIADQAMPSLEFILGQLAKDYRIHYPDKQKAAGYELYVDSPLGVDREAEKLDIEIRGDQQKLVVELVNQGYKRELAVKYAAGKIDLEGLGEPTSPPKVEPIDPNADPKADPNKEQKPGDKKPDPKAQAAKSNAADHCTCQKQHPTAKHELDSKAQAEVDAQTVTLQNVAVSVESHITAAVINKVTTNAFESEDDIIDAQARQDAERELDLALVSFYTVLLTLWAQEAMKRTSTRLGMGGTFQLDKEARAYIADTAKKTAVSHVSTVLGDLHATIQITARRLVDEEVARLKALPEIPGLPDKGDKAIYELARKTALGGAGQQEIVRAIRTEFQDITKTRATTIARDQAMRAYNRAQYEADREFIAQNQLEAQAFKRWRTRSGNPCPFCRAQAARGLIPFNEPFVKLGTVLTEPYTKADGSAGVRKLKVDYEEAQAGNLHTNCECVEELVIRKAK
jgi:hypothetical protein